MAEGVIFDPLEHPIDIRTVDGGNEQVYIMPTHEFDGGWNPEGYPDSKERIHKMLLRDMKSLGLGTGEKGWIEHLDQRGELVRDTFSLEGELTFAFISVSTYIDELKERISQLENQSHHDSSDRWQ